MFHRVLSIAGGLCAAVWLLAAAMVPLSSTAFGQSNDKPPDKTVGNGPDGGKEAQKVDEYGEARRLISGPAGNPECVWLGRRVVSLLWRDDLETAFRHMDLYDRFGCPGGHIQAAFRCLILHASSIDPKATDSLNGRIQACWIDPVSPAAASEPSASAPSPTTTR